MPLSFNDAVDVAPRGQIIQNEFYYKQGWGTDFALT